MIYLIAYDISENNIRSKVSEYLAGWGRRVQKSLFECDLEHDELDRIVSYIQEMIDPSEDRCSVYKICAECMSYKVVYGCEIEPKLGETIVV
jgi:CRISPR-associated protein Cas2